MENDVAGPTLRELMSRLVRRLSGAGVDSPGLSARALAGRALGLDQTGIIVESNRVLGPQEVRDVESLVARRETGEPLAYILGSREFYGLDFTVTPDTLIPRPETELIIDLACGRFAPDAAMTFADWGTGSGILAAMLALRFPRSQGLAVERSSGAIRVARANIRNLCADRVAVVRGDFLRPLIRTHSLDLLVCNPPYVSEAEFEAASPEVTAFEPRDALLSGIDGGDHIRGLAPLAKWALKPGGRLLMEMGCGQACIAEAALSAPGTNFTHIVVHKDLAGLDRIVEAW